MKMFVFIFYLYNYFGGYIIRNFLGKSIYKCFYIVGEKENSVLQVGECNMVYVMSNIFLIIRIDCLWGICMVGEYRCLMDGNRKLFMLNIYGSMESKIFENKRN